MKEISYFLISSLIKGAPASESVRYKGPINAGFDYISQF